MLSWAVWIKQPRTTSKSQESYTDLGEKYPSVGQELNFFLFVTELGVEKRRAILPSDEEGVSSRFLAN